MKARVKATGKIVDIYEQTLLTTFDSNDVRLDEVEFLEGDTNFTPDYWTRLEHTYVGMAMQGILACEEWKISPREGVSFAGEVALQAQEIAHALVEKMKEVK